MEKDFVPYVPSLELKELGFDEPCLGRHYRALQHSFDDPRTGREIIFNEGSPMHFSTGSYVTDEHSIIICYAPTFSQAFRFFREKHGYFTSPTEYDDDVIKKYDWHITKNLGNGKLLIHFVGYHNTYEEAELACLNKLIELVKDEK